MYDEVAREADFADPSIPASLDECQHGTIYRHRSTARWMRNREFGGSEAGAPDTWLLALTWRRVGKKSFDDCAHGKICLRSAMVILTETSENLALVGWGGGTSGSGTFISMGFMMRIFLRSVEYLIGHKRCADQ